jgi:hypothetical protein
MVHAAAFTRAWLAAGRRRRPKKTQFDLSVDDLDEAEAEGLSKAAVLCLSIQIPE